MSTNQFASVTMVVALSIPALVLLLKPPRAEEWMPKISLGKIAYALPMVVFLCASLETWSYGHLGLFSVIALMAVFTALAFSDSSSTASIAMALSLVAIIVVLYGVYSPSFGCDTWRDATQAAQIIERGGLRDLTIVHEAYPLPVVSILYAIYSIVSGLNTLWSSSVVGLAYLLLLALWMQVLARRVGAEHSHAAPLLMLTTPLVVIWSVWFIPQAYSLLMALPLLFLDLNSIIILILALALVLGHGGVALWTVVVLALLFIAKRALGVRSPILKPVDAKLAIVLALLIPLITCTTLSTCFQGALSSVLEAPQAILGGRSVEATASLQLRAPLIGVLSIASLAVLVALGLVVFIEDGDTAMQLLAFASLVGLGIAYVGVVAYPVLDLPRYLGLQSTVVLVALSPRALRALTKRGRRGSLYASLLLLLAIAAFGFAGSLMPENPCTANPYAKYSISGLLTYDEARELECIASLLCCNNCLVDWRAGSYMGYKYLWIQPQYRGFYVAKTDTSFTFAGSYGLIVTPDYLERFDGLLIFRKSASQMPETFLQEVALCITDNDGPSLYYSSNNMLVACFEKASP
jgi:hypothetical protein